MLSDHLLYGSSVAALAKEVLWLQVSSVSRFYSTWQSTECDDKEHCLEYCEANTGSEALGPWRSPRDSTILVLAPKPIEIKSRACGVRKKYFCKTSDREEQKEGMCSLKNRI